MRRRYVAVVSIAVGSLAMAVVLAATREGPGATVDSGEYLAVADGLRGGHGFTMPYVSYDEPYPDVVRVGERVPMTQYPPLFPAVLAAFGAVSGTSSLAAARWVNALAIGALVATVAALVACATQSWRWGALAGGVLVCPAIVYPGSMVWSEPLMLVLFVGAVAATWRALSTRSMTMLALATALAAAASLVRFPGITAVGAVGFLVLVHGGDRLPMRLRRAAAVVASGSLPLLGWFARNVALIEAPSEKTIAWHPPGLEVATRTMRTFTTWFMRDTPTRRAVLVPVVLILVGWGAASAVRALRRGSVRWDALPAVCAAFGLAYASFMLVSRALLDNNVVFSTRQLAPLHVLLVVGGLCASAAQPSRRRRLAVVALSVAVIASGTLRLATKTVPVFPDTHRAGYASAAWDASAGIAYIERLPVDTVVVTNAPDAVWIRTGRPSLFIPLAGDLYRGGPNERYPAQLEALAAGMRGHDALVVFFDHPTRRQRRTIDPRVIDALRLVRGQRLADATVFTVPTSLAVE